MLSFNCESCHRTSHHRSSDSYDLCWSLKPGVWATDWARLVAQPCVPLTRLEHGNTPRLLFRFLFYTHWSRWTSFSEEKRNSLSNFQRPAARHLGSQHVTRSSFRLFYLFLSNKVPIVCIMFLSPWVFPLPFATFLVAALRITQFSHLVLCALYSRHHC